MISPGCGRMQSTMPLLFEQMKGRGVRVIEPDKLRAVTPDAKHGKTRS